MEIIVCLDDRNGMLFNHRRQSRDRRVIEDILEDSKGRRLLISSFSTVLFEGKLQDVIVDDRLLFRAGDNDLCLFENIPLHPFEEKIGALVVYRWNRVYSADVSFDIDLNHGWKIKNIKEFSGYSHEKITKEVYTR